MLSFIWYFDIPDYDYRLPFTINHFLLVHILYTTCQYTRLDLLSKYTQIDASNFVLSIASSLRHPFLHIEHERGQRKTIGREGQNTGRKGRGKVNQSVIGLSGSDNGQSGQSVVVIVPTSFVVIWWWRWLTHHYPHTHTHINFVVVTLH